MGFLRVAVVLCATMVLCRIGMDVSAQQVDCNTVLLSVSSCLTNIEDGGTTAQSNSTCCTALQAVAPANVVCLCDLLVYGNDSNLLGVMINVTAARDLVSICDVTADESQCPGFAESPLASPVSGPSFQPGSPKPTSGGNTGNHASTELPSIKFCLQMATIAAIAPLYLFMN